MLPRTRESPRLPSPQAPHTSTAAPAKPGPRAPLRHAPQPRAAPAHPVLRAVRALRPVAPRPRGAGRRAPRNAPRELGAAAPRRPLHWPGARLPSSNSARYCRSASATPHLPSGSNARSGPAMSPAQARASRSRCVWHRDCRQRRAPSKRQGKAAAAAPPNASVRGAHTHSTAAMHASSAMWRASVLVPHHKHASFRRNAPCGCEANHGAGHAPWRIDLPPLVP
mmetsp:Transcript_132344/g.295969  ORF Transcript_132344/g.295969 Transcript_132344/m.295969 type:complete len:224 (+) Transcript_132344:694-1365(+)